MSTPGLIVMIASSAIFLLWAGLMFTTLWKLSRHAAKRLDETGGGYVRWAGHSLGSFGAFLSEPDFKKDRRRLLLVTLLLFASIAVRPILML
jgi:amino acid transporter